MKKVIDAGALRSDLLAEFLERSTHNFAVIVDYASMESLKGNSIENLRGNLRILSKHPGQIVVLKSTSKIIQLKPRSNGLHSRFIDLEQTETFGDYCETIISGRAPPGVIAADVTRKATVAKAHFERLQEQTEGIRQSMTQLASSYTAEDLKSLRSKKPISQSFSNRILEDILKITMIFFRDASGFKNTPDFADAKYSYPFRYALCSYLVTLKWIAESGYQNVAQEKIRNDYTDMTYAAYASFYDGLITRDAKLLEIHLLSRWILDNLAFD